MVDTDRAYKAENININVEVQPCTGAEVVTFDALTYSLTQKVNVFLNSKQTADVVVPLKALSVVPSQCGIISFMI